VKEKKKETKTKMIERSDRKVCVQIYFCGSHKKAARPTNTYTSVYKTFNRRKSDLATSKNWISLWKNFMKFESFRPMDKYYLQIRNHF
jgi:hypothetical protein